MSLSRPENTFNPVIDMFSVNRDHNTYPPAKPNGDTNRTLVDIEIALAREYHFEKNIVVYNVNGMSWVLPLLHECDMLVVSPKTRLLSEFEIKRTWTDFCADFQKRHHHESSSGIEISSFSYVVPEGLYEKAVQKLQKEKIVVTSIVTYNEELVFSHHQCLWTFTPEDEGRWYSSVYHNHDSRNLSVDDVRKGVEKGRYFTLDFTFKDKPTIIPKANARPLFTEQLLELARLGCMRQVSLREKISKIEKEIV